MKNNLEGITTVGINNMSSSNPKIRRTTMVESRSVYKKEWFHRHGQSVYDQTSP